MKFFFTEITVDRYRIDYCKSGSDEGPEADNEEGFCMAFGGLMSVRRMQCTH